MDWTKEPETTTNYHKEYGYLHYFNNLFELRFIFEPAKGLRDVWTLIYKPSGRTWSREGINEYRTCMALAERLYALEEKIK